MANQNLISRPPVVVVMGHIDHGKTSLLNAIRNLQFTGQKPGGAITQHIGAYQVEVPLEKEPKSRESEANRGIPRLARDDFTPGSRKITFIDTPGHEAFSAMRMRGAKVADLAVLVVDCCDGIKDQTKEAILHIKSAEIPMVVVLNKIDKPDANPEKAQRELQKEDILVESLGGKIPAIETSAKTGQGIPELLELILLISEMESLKADISKPARGSVIESFLDKQKGPVATLISDEGILKVGDIVGTASSFGKIKNLENFQGLLQETAFPSEPVAALGFEKSPKVGEVFKVFPDTESAKNSLQAVGKKETYEITDISGEKQTLNLILKADCLGSLEAIEEILSKLPQEKVILRILKSEVGEINESDIKFAKAFPAKGYPALILGFRVKTSPMIENLAEKEKIRIMTFEIIYDLVEGARKFMEKILEPEEVRTNLGKLKVLMVFLTEKNRMIAGGKIIEGEIKKGTQIEVLRQEELLGRGRLINLQKNKKDAEKAVKGEECGILYEGNVKIEVGDVLVIYTEERKKGEL